MVVGVTGTDGFEHVLRRVRLGRALVSAVGLEVLDQVLAVFSEGTVIDNASTGFEKQEFVEVFEQDG